jgi:hypothetical protein
MPTPFVSEPIELRRWAWWRWPWRSAIILKARECRAGTLRGRQLRRARLDVLRDIHLQLPGIAPTPTSYYDVSPEEEWVRRWDEMAASVGDADYWHSLWQEAMAQGRGLDFAVREREYRERAAQEVRDRAATLLDRLGAYTKAILRQSPYRVVGYRAEADTGHVERNRTTLTADDFAVFSVDLSNGCLVVPGVGLKYVGVTVREFQIADGDGGREVDLTEEPGSLPSQPLPKVMTSSEPCTLRDGPGDQTVTADSGERDAEQDCPVLSDGAQPKTRTGRRGRKPGSGLINDDQPLMEMLHLLATGEAPSVWAAAGRFAGGNESTQRRLSTKFGDKWGKDHPPGKTWKDVEGELKTN